MLRRAAALVLIAGLSAGLGYALGSEGHRRVVADGAALRPNAPFTPGVMAGDLLYLSGNIGVDPATGKVPAAFADAARQCLANQLAILKAAGLGWEDAVKVNVYVEDMARYEEFNELYMKALPAPYPARTFVAVADLPGGAQVEVEVVAVRRH